MGSFARKLKRREHMKQEKDKHTFRCIDALNENIKSMKTDNIDKIEDEVKLCLESLIPHFKHEGPIELPQITLSNEGSFYYSLKKVISLSSLHPFHVGEEVSHFLHRIVNPSLSEYSDELYVEIMTLKGSECSELRKAQEYIDAAKDMISVRECVGKYGAVIYCRLKEDSRSLALYDEEISFVRRKYNELNQQFEKADKFNPKDFHLFATARGYLLADSFFRKYRESKLAEAARVQTWKELKSIASY